MKLGVSNGLRLLTSGALQLPEEIEAAMGQVVEEIAKTQIAEYEADKRTIEDFRRELGDLVKELRSACNSTAPLVFVIDELDRCRPNYAIALLEKVKHLFNVPGLVFILAIDRTQLAESVRALYGSGFNAHDYLRRFIDFEYRLQDAVTPEFLDLRLRDLAIAENIENRPSKANEDFEWLEICLTIIFTAFRFDLRTQEQLLAHLSVVLRVTSKMQYIGGPLLPLLLSIRSSAGHSHLYEDYCSGRLEPAKLFASVQGLNWGRGFWDSQDGILLEAFIYVADPDDQRRGDKFTEGRRVLNAKDDVNQRQKELHHAMIRLQDFKGFARKLRERIEIAAQFSIFPK